MYKLGKHHPVPDPKALKMARYLSPSILPTLPAHVNWGAQVPQWPMYGNDTIGDCTIAAAAHMEGLWSFRESGSELIVPEDEITKAYTGVSGYIPGHEDTDNGANMTTVLNYWIGTGIGGSKAYSYAACSARNRTHIKAATFLFGSCYVGLALPVTAQAQSGPNQCWSVSPTWESDPDGQPGSWGGHCVPVVGYNADTLCVITWGFVQYVTWNFWNLYTDEAYAVLSQQWAPAGGTAAPNKFNLAQLQEDQLLVQN